jgi:hypothetical protein
MQKDDCVDGGDLSELQSTTDKWDTDKTGLMVTSVTKCGTQKLPKIVEIVETYRHDHSLESSCGALSDGTRRYSIRFISGEEIAFSTYFSNKLSS